MKKIILSTLVVATLFSACKKDEKEPEVTYPQVYKFESATNASAISVFTKTAVINATNHPSATDPEIVNFNTYLAEENTFYTGLTYTLIDANHVKVHDNSGDPDTTVTYTQSGDNLVMGGLLTFKKTDATLALENYFWVTRYTGNGDRYSSGGILDGSSLKDAVQADMDAGDTTAARSYDLVFKKQ